MSSKIKLIKIGFNSGGVVIDMTIPKHFTFKCKVPHRSVLEKDEEFRKKGVYDYDSYLLLTAEQILKGHYPDDTVFYFNTDEEMEIRIPLSCLECRYVDNI